VSHQVIEGAEVTERPDGLRPTEQEALRGVAVDGTQHVELRVGLPPLALIDHVLVSRDLAVASVDEVAISGSDHRAVVATIGPKAP
jgi:endonuclease/exonuclease/phosphatase family metal-dependent hydrolase